MRNKPQTMLEKIATGLGAATAPQSQQVSVNALEMIAVLEETNRSS